MKKQCIIRKSHPSSNSHYFYFLEVGTEKVIAWGMYHIAVTPILNTIGGVSEIVGYENVSVETMTEISETPNNFVDVHYENVKCDTPCGMCFEFGCMGKEWPLKINNKLIIEWKKS